MASLVTSENWGCINSEFLTSLMELEPQDQVEEGDEERLNSVIQALEAEINSSTMDGDDHDQWISDGEFEDNQSRGLLVSQSEGQNWLVSLDHDQLDVMNGWIEMEQVMPCSSPSHDMNYNLYMYECGDEMMSFDFNGVTGFGGVITTDYDHTCDEIAFDMSQGYSSLWQETLYDSMMYD